MQPSKLSFAAAILSSAVSGLLRAEKRPSFGNPLSQTIIEGIIHSEHTTGKFGEFLHPFHQVAPEVQTIVYPESKTISKKLHRVRGPSRHDPANSQGRAINGKN